MKRIIILAAAFLLTALTAPAQDSHLSLFGSSASFRGETAITPSVDTDLDDAIGAGFAFSHSWGRFSAEVSLSRLSADASLTRDGATIADAGNLTMTPLAVTGRWNVLPGRVTPFVEAGLAFVVLHDIGSSDLEALGIESVEVGDELTTVAGAGVDFRLSERFTIFAGARYMNLDPPGVVREDGVAELIDIHLDPLVTSAGLRWTF